MSGSWTRSRPGSWPPWPPGPHWCLPPEGGAGRHGRHDHRGPRLRQAGRRLRLHRRAGMNALIATVTTKQGAGHRRATPTEGIGRFARGAARLVADTLRPPAPAPQPATGPVLLRADSAFYGRPQSPPPPGRGRRVRHGAADPTSKAIGTIDEDAWTTIKYTDAVFDEPPGPGSPAPRSPRSPSPRSPPGRRPSRSPAGSSSAGSPTSTRKPAGQPTLFDTWRFHAFFTTQHPGHRRRGQDPPRTRHHRAGPRRPERLRPGPPALGKFTANAAWLVLAVMAFNLTRAARRRDPLAKATTGTIRRTLIHVPARIAGSARRLTLHLPTGWPWQDPWTELFTRTCGPPKAHTLTTQPATAQATPRGTPRPRSGHHLSAGRATQSSATWATSPGRLVPHGRAASLLELPRHVRRLRTLGRLESCQETHTGGTRLS